MFLKLGTFGWSKSQHHKNFTRAWGFAMAHHRLYSSLKSNGEIAITSVRLSRFLLLNHWKKSKQIWSESSYMNLACNSTNCFALSPWEAGVAKRSSIIKFQLQCHFQRILHQTLCQLRFSFGSLNHVPGSGVSKNLFKMSNIIRFLRECGDLQWHAIDCVLRAKSCRLFNTDFFLQNLTFKQKNQCVKWFGSRFCRF